MAEQSAKRGEGSGNGKLILFGEHTVVYGAPAIVAGLPGGATARAVYSDAEESVVRLSSKPGETPKQENRGAVDEAFAGVVSEFEAVLDGPVDIEVDVDIPIGVGLGSSAAFSAAVARALADLTGADDRIEGAVEAGERVFHGNPSGIDQLAALRGGLLFYRRGDMTEQAPIEAEAFRIGVCVAGPPASTAEMVEGVAGLRSREPDLFDYIKLLVGDATRFASGALREGDWERVGELMDINHGALVSLGVSTSELDEACHIARDAGALGSKLTGAGGGGCVVALLPESGAGVIEAWESHGLEAFEVEIE